MINDYVREPQSGKEPEHLVIYFHGYGSSGALMSQYVGDLLGPMLPEAKLRFPDAPVQMGWDNHSWFELRDVIDDAEIPEMHRIVSARASAAAKDMNDYIDRVIKEEGISEDRVIIAGFSQGGTMAFYTGLMRDTPVAGVFALSGGALDHIPAIKSKPPVALVAGELEKQDYSGAPHAEKSRAFLAGEGFTVSCDIVPHQRHETSPRAMQLLADFTRKVASGPKPSVAQDQDNKSPKPPRRTGNSGPKLH